jgi:hypothetical protein
LVLTMSRLGNLEIAVGQSTLLFWKEQGDSAKTYCGQICEYGAERSKGAMLNSELVGHFFTSHKAKAPRTKRQSDPGSGVCTAFTTAVPVTSFQ